MKIGAGPSAIKEFLENYGEARCPQCDRKSRDVVRHLKEAHEIDPDPREWDIVEAP